MTHGPSPKELLEFAPKLETPPHEPKPAKDRQQQEKKPEFMAGDPFDERLGEKFAFAVVALLIMFLFRYMGW